jgi:hypothetical protein
VVTQVADQRSAVQVRQPALDQQAQRGELLKFDEARAKEAAIDNAGRSVEDTHCRPLT